jgi:hypothetical protein
MIWAKENTALKATWAGAVTVAGTEIGVVVSSASQPLLKESNAGSTPLTFTSKTPKVCTVDSPTYVGNSTTHTKATVKALFNGICQIESSFAGNSYWLPVTSIASITISGITTPQPGASAPQAINFSQPANTPADKSVALTATATSGLAVTIASLTPAVCAVTQDANGKYSAAAVSGLSGDLNNCQLQATQAGDTRWAAAPAVVKSFRFVRVAQTISFTAPTSRFFGGPLTQLVATSTSGLPVTFTSKTPAICSVAAGETTSVLAYVTPLTTSSSATCAIEASQAGDNTYAPATNINRFVSLRKESTTIKATWAGPISVDGTNLDLLVTSTSQPSLNEKVADVAALVVTSRTPGICKVENAQYLGTDSVHTRVVVKAMWNGTCSLTAAYAGHTYWLASSQSISTSITKMTTPQPGANAAQMISMSMPTAIGIAQTAILAPSATSKLKVELTTTTPAVCVVIATTASYTVKAAPGVVGNGNICTLQATQAGNESWAAAPTFTRNLTINKANMAIRLSRWSSGITGKTPALFTAGVAYVDGPSNGGLNSIGHLLTISTSTPGVCSVTDVGPSATTTGTFTQATITGITNGTCAVTLKFAATDTQNEIVLLRNITISGIK